MRLWTLLESIGHVPKAPYLDMRLAQKMPIVRLWTFLDSVGLLAKARNAEMRLAKIIQIVLDSVGLVTKVPYVDMQIAQIMQTVLLVDQSRLSRTCDQGTLCIYAINLDNADSAVMDLARLCRTC